jgi:hypothetical protein
LFVTGHHNITGTDPYDALALLVFFHSCNE